MTHDTTKLRDAVVEAAQEWKAHHNGTLGSPDARLWDAVVAFNAADRQPKAKMTHEERFERSSIRLDSEWKWMDLTHFLREAREIAIEALGEARRAIHDSRDMFPGSGRGTESAVEAIDRLIAQKRSAR